MEVCVEVCVLLCMGRWLVGGWRCMEMEALRIVGMFGVWWFWVCLVCGGVWRWWKDTEVCGECVIVCREEGGMREGWKDEGCVLGEHRTEMKQRHARMTKRALLNQTSFDDVRRFTKIKSDG